MNESTRDMIAPVAVSDVSGGEWASLIWGFVLGLVVGILGLRVYITWLLQSRFGPFRLVLVRRDGAQPSGAGHSVTVRTA